jgi:hypothetical protein
MARIAKSTMSRKPAAKGRGTGRPTAPAAKTTAKARLPKVTKVVAAKRVATTAAPVQKVSKDELRAQVEKLERTNATLRTRSREANRAAKTAAARIAALEEQVARLEKQVAAQTTRAERGQPASPPKGRRRVPRREIDPGDAVPPGVAVEEPAAPDLEAEMARENLEEHLGGQTLEGEPSER